LALRDAERLRALVSEADEAAPRVRSRRWIVLFAVLLVVAGGATLFLLLHGGTTRCDSDVVAGCRDRCDSDEPDACYRLGMALDKGAPKMPRDRAAALTALDQACELGYGDGCYDAARVLGDLVDAGAIAREAGLARQQELLERGCELGAEAACKAAAAAGNTPP